MVRLTIVDRDDDRIVFGIMPESAAWPDDVVQDCGGLTIATEARNAARMDGVTLGEKMYSDPNFSPIFLPNFSPDPNFSSL